MIEVKNISLTLNKKKILENISFVAKRGEIVGLVGYNGSGKTMIMKCICGFITSYDGKIMLDGENILQKEIDRRNMGVIIETPSFIPFYSGMKNLCLLADLNGKINYETVGKYMLLLGLEPKSRLKVKKYSLGMKQRLGIAQALMENPDILILDEPFNGLDYEMSQTVRKIILEEKEKGKMIILTSHNPYDIDALCDKVVTIKNGRIEENPLHSCMKKGIIS